MRRRFFRLFVAAPIVVAVTAGGSLLLGGVASAAPPAGSLGTLTFTPSTGIDTQIITVHTAGGCAAGSSAAEIDVAGPLGAATPTFSVTDQFPITTAESTAFSKTAPFTVEEGLSLKAAADQVGKPLAVGEYDFTLHCLNQETLQDLGTFTGAIFFADTTHYNAGDAPGPSPSPGASPSPSSGVSPSPSSTPTDSPTPTPSTTPDSTTSATSTTDAAGATTSSDPPAGTQPVVSSGPLANTGAPIAVIFLGGVILLAAGLALVVWIKRPKRATLSDGDDTSER